MYEQHNLSLKPTIVGSIVSFKSRFIVIWFCTKNEALDGHEYLNNRWSFSIPLFSLSSFPSTQQGQANLSHKILKSANILVFFCSWAVEHHVHTPAYTVFNLTRRSTLVFWSHSLVNLVYESNNFLPFRHYTGSG